MNEEPLFEVVSEVDFKAASRSKPRTSRSGKFNTEDRTHNGWYKLPHTVHGFCTVPKHVEVQQSLNSEQLEYRDKYPTRMLFEIGDYLVCKDCYLAGADQDE